MAGDKKGEQRKVINQEGQHLRQVNQQLSGVLEPQYATFMQNYQQAVPQQMGDYSRLMGQYGDFAKTGGFSPDDLANIRARSVSPTRGIYSQMQQGLQRQRSLQGGYSPGFATASSRLAREGSQQISDINRATEADIAQMVQRGKLAGIQGGSSLYGTAPGMVGTFGSQVLGAGNQLLGSAQLENQLGLGLIGAHQNSQQLPGKWEGTLGRIGDIFGLGGQIAGGIYPWLGGGSSNLNPLGIKGY